MSRAYARPSRGNKPSGGLGQCLSQAAARFRSVVVLIADAQHPCKAELLCQRQTLAQHLCRKSLPAPRRPDGIADVSAKAAQKFRQLKFQAENADQRIAVIAQIKILPHIAIRQIFAGVPVLHAGQPAVKIPVISNTDAFAAAFLNFAVEGQNVLAACAIR